MRLSGKVLELPLAKDVERICGMDVSYRGDMGAGAAAVLSYPEMELLEERRILKRALIPYTSTFLAFREMPYFASLVRALRTRPQVFLINGHGLYHPAFLGAASHFGVVFDVPSIGVASRPLRLNGEGRAGCNVIYRGRVVATLMGSLGKEERLYVSVGHRTTLEQAIAIVRGCLKGHRMPEPLFLADSISRETVRGTW